MKKLLLIFTIFCLIGYNLSAQTPVASYPLNESATLPGDPAVTGDNQTMATVGDWTTQGVTLTGGYDSGDTGHALTLRIESNDGSDDRAELAVVDWEITPVVDRSYILSFQYKWISKSGTNRVSLLGNTLDQMDASVGTWTNYSNTFVAADNSTQLRIYSSLGGAATDELLIDNVALRLKVGKILETQQGSFGVPTDVYNVQDHRGSGRRWNQYDGVDDFHEVGAITELNSATTFTIILEGTKHSSSDAIVVGSSITSTNRVLIAWFSDDNIYCIVSNTANTFNLASYAELGKHSVALVYNGAEGVSADRVKIYIDGSFVSSAETGTLPATTSATAGNTFRLMREDTGYESGDVSMTRVFDTALSAGDVAYYSIPSNPIKSADESACVLNLNAEGIRSNQWYDQLNGIVATNNGATMQIPSTSNLGAMWFNGSTAEVVFTGMDGLVGDITISGWFWPTTWGGGDDGTLLTNEELLIKFDNDSGEETVYFTRASGGAQALAANSAITLDAVNLITITSSSTGITNFYINGVLSGTANQSTVTPVSSTTLKFGNNTIGRRYEGWMKGIIIDKYIWSQDKITEEANKYKN